jgi:hydroxypyruvate isomerase
VLKFAANLNTLFQELPFLDRFAAAADAGFRGVEILRPYGHPKQVIAKRLRVAGLECALLNSPAGDWDHGERGLACHAGRVQEFRHSIEVGLRYCEALGCRRMHVLAGITQPGSTREAYVRNLHWAAQRAGDDMTVLVEAINPRDMPGYFTNTQAQSAAVCETVGLANLKMQIDCYHMQIVDGDLTTRLRQYISRCGHIQIAGVPDRHEPDSGEVNYAHVFALLNELGYQGWVGCEYHPRAGTVEGLGWVERLTGHKLSALSSD